MRRASGLFRRASRAPAESAAEDAQPGDDDPNPLVAQQKKTFRRWCNQYLEDRSMEVKHVLKDWESGILLCNLMEVLAKTNLGKINAAPRLELQKLENLNKALAFIGKNVKIVNIGSKDILMGNQTIILGLLWTLILRWGLKLKDGKAGLLAWVNERTGGKSTNFTSDWQDGMLMAALVATVAPNHMDFTTCSSSDPAGNFEKAFEAAEKALGIHKLLDPKDVVANPEEKSLIAYVGSVYGAVTQPKDDKPAESAPAQLVIKEVEMEDPKIYNVHSTSCDVDWAVPAGAVAVRVALKPTNREEWPTEPGPDNQELPEDRKSTTFGNLDPETAYAVMCVAVLASGKMSKPSGEVQFTTLDAGAPPAPRLSQPTPSSIAVEWDAVPTAVLYKVQVDEGVDGNFAKELQTSDCACVVEDLGPGTANAFRVVAVLASGKETAPSPASQEKTRMPNPTDAPEVSELTDRAALLTIAPLAGAATYEVHVRSPPAPWEDADDAFSPMSVPAEAGAAVALKELDPNTEYEVRVVAVSAAGVAAAPFPSAVFCTPGPGPRFALVTAASTASGVQVVASLLMTGSTSGEVGASSSSFGFDNGFTNVFCFTRDPPLPELRELAESSKTLVVITLDPEDPSSVADAARVLPAGVDLLINNGNLPRKMICRLLG